MLLWSALLIKILLLLYAVDSRYKEPQRQAKTVYIYNMLIMSVCVSDRL
jgi:hypothetical protein